MNRLLARAALGLVICMSATRAFASPTMYSAQDGCEVDLYEDAGATGGKITIKGGIANFAGTYFAGPGMDSDLTIENNVKNRIAGGREVNDRITAWRVKRGHWTFFVDKDMGAGPVSTDDPLYGRTQDNLEVTNHWAQDAISSASCKPE